MRQFPLGLGVIYQEVEQCYGEFSLILELTLGKSVKWSGVLVSSLE